jgi:hypothetical protein
MILKKTALIFLLLIYCLAIAAQKEVPMFTAPDKKSTRPNAFAAKVSAPQYKAMKAVPYEIEQSVDDGVVIMAGDEVYKYDANFKLVFKSDISNMLKFPELTTYTSIDSDDKATYILEVKKNSKEKASVIHINQKGEARQESYLIDIADNLEYSTFIANGKLCILGKDIDKKKDKVVYKFYYINPTDNKLTSKIIDLPTDSYEYEKIRKNTDRNHFWRVLGNQGDKVILIKYYFKEIEHEKKKKTFVCQLAEVDMQGNVTEGKTIDFQPKLAGDDREFVRPLIIFNNADASVYIVGYMEIDKNKINGLYLLKYDYLSGQLIYTKEHAFKEFMKPDVKKNAKVHYNIPEHVDQYYPLEIRYPDVLIDKVNNFLNLRIITDFGFNNTTFFDVSFDKYGDPIKVGVSEYDGFLNYYGYYVLTPTGYQLVWADKSKPYVVSAKPGPWDFIDSKAQDKKSKLYWVPFSTTQGNRVVKYDSDDRIFTGIVLDK